MSAPDATLFDKKGVIVAHVKARSGSGNSRSVLTGSGLGALMGGEATLYQKGSPASTLRADRIDVDQATQTVTGTGNVVARSLTEVGAPAIRADKMTWRHDKNEIRGSGNVLVTRDPDMRLPGKSFVADTRLRRFTLTSSGAPASGTF